MLWLLKDQRLGSLQRRNGICAVVRPSRRPEKVILSLHLLWKRVSLHARRPMIEGNTLIYGEVGCLRMSSGVGVDGLLYKISYDVCES
jgi:hypothetical protein